MWNMKCVIRATRIVTDSLKKNLEEIAGKHSGFIARDNYACNITHNTESTAV